MCWLRCWKLCCWFLYYVHNSDPVKTKSKGRVMFDPFGTWSRTTESDDVSSAKNIFVVLAKKILGIVKMSLLNCAPCAPLCLRALPIVGTRLTCLRAYVPYQLLIRTCAPYAPYEPTDLTCLCLAWCCVTTIER